jgi:hypothetical protein
MGCNAVGQNCATPDLPLESPDHPPEEQVVKGVTYRPQWDFSAGTWDMVDASGHSLYSTTVTPGPSEDPQQCHAAGHENASSLDTFRKLTTTMASQLQQKAKMQAAYDKMVEEHGPELQSLQAQLENAQRSDAPAADRQAMIDGAKAQIRKITDQYAPMLDEPPVCRRQEPPGGVSPSTPNSSGVRLPVSMPYAPDIVPTKAEPFGSVGGIDYEHEAMRSGIENAYAYDLQNTGTQVANDLERLAGVYKEIHVLSGVHGRENSGFGSSDPQQLKTDRTSALETQQRHPGVKVMVYDATNSKDLQKFIALQKDAASARTPEVATLDAVCYGRNRMSDPTGGPPVPIVGPGEVKMAGAVHGGAAILSGGVMIQNGLDDPNKTVGAVKVTVGAAQAAGGTAYAVGMLTDSARLARAGSVTGEVAGKLVAPIVAYDVYRHMSTHITGDLRSKDEQMSEGVTDALAVGSVLFAEFTLPALAIQFGAKAAGNYVVEHQLPMIVDGIYNAYGIRFF